MEFEVKRKVKSCYSLPERIVKQLNEQAAKKDLNKSTLIQLALEEYFRKEEQGVQV